MKHLQRARAWLSSPGARTLIGGLMVLEGFRIFWESTHDRLATLERGGLVPREDLVTLNDLARSEECTKAMVEAYTQRAVVDDEPEDGAEA